MVQTTPACRDRQRPAISQASPSAVAKPSRKPLELQNNRNKKPAVKLGSVTSNNSATCGMEWRIALSCAVEVERSPAAFVPIRRIVGGRIGAMNRTIEFVNRRILCNFPCRMFRHTASSRITLPVNDAAPGAHYRRISHLSRIAECESAPRHGQSKHERSRHHGEGHHTT